MYKKEGLQKCFIIFSVIAITSCVLPAKSRAYIMPAEQIMGFMAAKFSKIKTLVITHSTSLINQDDHGPETVIKEKLWLKAPGFMYSYIEKEPGAEGTGSGLEQTGVRLIPDMSFRKIFMGNSRTGLKELLYSMGINVESVWYTRLDGVIAYQIGDKYQGGPRLLIEKDRFLPLLISYRLSGDSKRRLVNVRFEKYREIAGAWYPYQITYFLGQDMLERYTIIDLQLNVPIEPSIFENQGSGARARRDFEYSQDAQDEKRLKDIIRLLEEKYQ